MASFPKSFAKSEIRNFQASIQSKILRNEFQSSKLRSNQFRSSKQFEILFWTLKLENEKSKIKSMLAQNSRQRLIETE